MNNRRNNAAGRRRTERRLLPFFIEFVKFSAGFAAIIAIALLTLRVASAALP
ncbi:hypothetical protein KGM48_03570 [Patescibacteria group bacterium]|nr:hypothetical protein [Patescibacteria group bacterium]